MHSSLLEASDVLSRTRRGHFAFAGGTLLLLPHESLARSVRPSVRPPPRLVRIAQFMSDLQIFYGRRKAAWGNREKESGAADEPLPPLVLLLLLLRSTYRDGGGGCCFPPFCCRTALFSEATLRASVGQSGGQTGNRIGRSSSPSVACVRPPPPPCAMAQLTIR